MKLEILNKSFEEGPRVGKFAIINFEKKDYMKDENGNVNFYETYKEAALIYGMYEFSNAWIVELKYNHVEMD